jgi:hypothetical protein
MIKLSLTPDPRFANDELTNRKARIALYDSPSAPAFVGTFSILPTGSSSQVAITAQATIFADLLPIQDPKAIVVELKANVIKTVHFNKGQTEVDTGIPLDYIANDHMEMVKPLTPANQELYTFSSTKHGDGENATYTLVVERLSGIDTALDAEVEIADVVVATGSLVGNSTGFFIRGSDAGDPVRIHALCNWVDEYGLNKNLESFKMVTKDHNAIVLTLGTK